MKKFVWVGTNTEEATRGKLYKGTFSPREEGAVGDPAGDIHFINNLGGRDCAGASLFITKKQAKRRYYKTDFYLEVYRHDYED